VTRENLSNDLLTQIYHTAGFEISFDDDGDLWVKWPGGRWCNALPQGERIHLLLAVRSNDSNKKETLELANRLNSELAIVRVSLPSTGSIPGHLVYDYDIPVAGGISQKAVLATTKCFVAVINSVETGDIEQAVSLQEYGDAEEDEMTDDLVTQDNLSHELVKGIYDAALMDVTLTDGELVVKWGGISCQVFPQEGRVRLVVAFGTNDSSVEKKLEFVNRVNSEYIIVRASINANGTLIFDYDVPVAGGITRKAIALVTQRFMSIPVQAIREYGLDIVG
jgi:hypothetical protein